MKMLNVLLACVGFAFATLPSTSYSLTIYGTGDCTSAFAYFLEPPHAQELGCRRASITLELSDDYVWGTLQEFYSPGDVPSPEPAYLDENAFIIPGGWAEGGSFVFWLNPSNDVDGRLTLFFHTSRLEFLSEESDYWQIWAEYSAVTMSTVYAAGGVNWNWSLTPFRVSEPRSAFLVGFALLAWGITRGRGLVARNHGGISA